MKHWFVSALVTVGLVFVATLSAQAQATRTWVSGVGDDANPCSRTAPCKTFAGAISKTAAGGEIDVLDPGGFGAVTITKSISIEAEGVIAGVLVSGTNGIVVNAAVTDNVTLRGLTFEGLGTGLAGIKFLNGGTLTVDSCHINNFTGAGIDFEPATAGNTQLHVRNTSIQNNTNVNTGGGVLVAPAANVFVKGTLDKVEIDHNGFGVKVQDRAQLTIQDSTISGSTFKGVRAVSTAGAGAQIAVFRSILVGNETGAQADGATAVVGLDQTFITANSIGVGSVGGSILSFGNNAIVGNTSTGTLTPTPLQ